MVPLRIVTASQFTAHWRGDLTEKRLESGRPRHEKKTVILSGCIFWNRNLLLKLSLGVSVSVCVVVCLICLCVAL